MSESTRNANYDPKLKHLHRNYADVEPTHDDDEERAYQDAMLDMENWDKIGEAIGDKAQEEFDALQDADPCIGAITCIMQPTMLCDGCMGAQDKYPDDYTVPQDHSDPCKTCPDHVCHTMCDPGRLYHNVSINERRNDETLNRLSTSPCDDNMDTEPFRYVFATNRPGYRRLAKVIIAIVAGAIVAYILLSR